MTFGEIDIDRGDTRMTFGAMDIDREHPNIFGAINKQREGEYSIYSLQTLYGAPRTRERRGKERRKEVRGSEVMRLLGDKVNLHNR